jgi:hypothetical protein
MHSCKDRTIPPMLRVINLYTYIQLHGSGRVRYSTPEFERQQYYATCILHSHGYAPTRPPGQNTRQCPARCPLWHFSSRGRWIPNVYIVPSAARADTPLVNDIFIDGIGIWRLSERFHFFQVPTKCPFSSSNNQSSEGR